MCGVSATARYGGPPAGRQRSRGASRPRSALWIGALLVTGCAPQTGAGEDASDATDPDVGDSDADTGGDADADTDTDADTDAEDDASGPLLEGEIEVLRYETQPMIVDLRFSLGRPAEIGVEHADDPGVRGAKIEGDETGPVTVRVRGLLPAAGHALTLHLEGGDESEDHPVEFTTHAPLERFTPQYVVVGETSAADGSYRLFDEVETEANRGSIVQTDPHGRTRWYWTQTFSGSNLASIAAGVKLLDDGSVIFVGEYDFWRVEETSIILSRLDTAEFWPGGFHHDVIALPNGNYMAIGYDFREINTGTGVEKVVGDTLVEFDEDGVVAWTWSTFDHLDVDRRPAGWLYLVSQPGTGEGHHDWTHGNGIVHDPETDLILFSMRHQDWIIAIDKSTGALVWRLGPEGDFELIGDHWFYHQHCPEWQEDGTLLLYDNGLNNPDLSPLQERSRGLQLALDQEAMTAEILWESTPQNYMAPVAGDIDRLPNGHVLLLDSNVPSQDSKPFQREIDTDTDEEVWRMIGHEGRLWYRALPTDRLVGMAAR